MGIERIDNLDDPRIEAYRAVRERDVRRRHGLFLVEGRFNVRTLLGPRSLYEPDSLLLTPAAHEAIADAIGAKGGAPPVYLAEQAVMNAIVGFDIHRGCLAAARRPEARSAEALVGDSGGSSASLLVVLEGLNNHDNIGGILRNAAAFGAGALLLDPTSADPLYRKSIRVSMGGALVVPHARFDAWPDGLGALEEAGYAIVGLTPDPGAPEIGALGDTLGASRRVALLLGAEGPGLSRRVLDRAHHRVRVPMRTDWVDSLNVASTSAIALHELSRTDHRSP